MAKRITCEECGAIYTPRIYPHSDILCKRCAAMVEPEFYRLHIETKVLGTRKSTIARKKHK